MCIEGVCVGRACCERGGVLVVLLVFLPFVERFLLWCCLFGIEGGVWIDGIWRVSLLSVGIVVSVESERLEGDDIALGDKDLLVEVWMFGGTSVDRASLSILHWWHGQEVKVKGRLPLYGVLKSWWARG